VEFVQQQLAQTTVLAQRPNIVMKSKESILALTLHATPTTTATPTRAKTTFVSYVAMTHNVHPGLLAIQQLNAVMKKFPALPMMSVQQTSASLTIPAITASHALTLMNKEAQFTVTTLHTQQDQKTL
jgi:hypothetical protein